MSPSQTKVAIRNVTVFDGQHMQSGETVAFENGLIVSDAAGADTVVDAHGAFLFPGLIDCHAHVHSVEDLHLMARHGVTTCLDMGTKDIAIFKSLRGGVGTCDIRSAGIPAMPPGSRHTSRPGFPRRLLVSGPEDAEQFVSDRISDGADYIKVMLEAEGPDQATVNALAVESHAQGQKVIAHATTCDAVKKAIEAKVDVVTHVPLEEQLCNETVFQMKAARSVSVPTLVKMLATAVKDKALDFSNSELSTKGMKEADVPILAGTDANKNASGVGKVSYGNSMWKELELLVEVGLSPTEAIQAATALPASFFGLEDRGRITQGKRADLVLMSKNPLENISNISSIQRVWCSGVEVERSV